MPSCPPLNSYRILDAIRNQEVIRKGKTWQLRGNGANSHLYPAALLPVKHIQDTKEIMKRKKSDPIRKT